jgi:alpha,alpha-trehalase
MTEWSLIYDGFDPKQEGLREALCTLGNGYFATRGAAEEAVADDIHYPGTYFAGGYNRLQTRIAGRVVENEDLVNFPNWLCLGFRVAGGDWFNPMAAEIVAYRQEMDLRRGVLLREVRFRDREGRATRLASRRLVHMAEPHYAAIETTITAENWSGRGELISALDGRVLNAGVERYRELDGSHLEPVETGRTGDDAIYLIVETSQSRIFVAEAARTRLYRDGDDLSAERGLVEEPGYVAETLAFDIRQGEPVTVEKIVALYSSRDWAISECGLAAREAVDRPGRFGELLVRHERAWAQLWRRADITVDQGPERHTQLVLRLHVFHLLQTISPNSMHHDVGVPARGLHGEAYRGHVFWDELFIFPFFNYRFPGLTRALLLYRYRRLREARHAARMAGFRGALFPWQSGSSGREESQRVHLNPRSGRWLPDHSHLQRHVNAAIAYNVWQYYEATSDTLFMANHGAEMIIEIARLWSSIATYNRGLGRYEIRGVMGPDEYHDGYPGANEPGLNNNAYTNVMAVWALCCALQVLLLLPPDRRAELCERLAVQDDEIARWEEVSRKMRIVFHADGVISQFEGYDDLEEFDWAAYRAKYGDIQRLDRILEAEGDAPNRYKLSKQADVLMLFYLFSSEELGYLFRRLNYPFEYDTIPKTVEYYLARSAHGSTLSRVIHSWVLARADRPRAWKLFLEALNSDIGDVQGGTTREGIHLGAMAATVDLVQRCYTGCEMRDNRLWFNPCLPDELNGLNLSLRYQGNALGVGVTPQRLRIGAGRSTRAPIEFNLQGVTRQIAPGEEQLLTL